MQISGLSKAAEILGDKHQPPYPALKLAEDATSFIRSHLYDETSGELRRSYREGPGPIGQCDDYAFLIQGRPYLDVSLKATLNQFVRPTRSL